jgi:hypothetical protein
MGGMNVVATNMETTNNTDDDTEYRTMPRPPKDREQQSLTRSRLPKEPRWILIRARQKRRIPHPPCPFTIEFRVKGKIVCSKDCDSPLRGVTLVKEGKKYQCLLQAPEQKPRPRRPRKPAKLEISS